MRTLTWKEEYSVGVKSLDSQHQHLLQSLNQVSALFEANANQEEINTLLNDLDTYAGTHFKTEEQFFEKFKFHDAEDHIQEHRMYEQKIEAYRQKYQDRLIEGKIELLEFLADWWMGHIQGRDQDYRRFLNNCGVF